MTQAPLKPLVFIHGFLGSKKDWTHISSFQFPGYQNYYFELPGHSTSPAETSQTAFSSQVPLQKYDLTSMAHHLSTWLQQHKISKPLLWGYSLGGRCALKFYELFPQETQGLILESSGCGALSPEESRARLHSDALWSQKLITLELQVFLEQWYAQDLFETLKKSPNYLKTLSIRTGISAPIAAQMLGEASPVRNPLLSPLEIQVPALILLGEKDIKYRTLWAPFIAKNKNLDIRILPQAGHALHLEVPELLQTEVGSWLSSTS